MAKELLYQVIAIAPRLEPRALANLQIALEETFDLDLAPVMDAFTGIGVCIHRTPELKEAEDAADMVRQLGAHYLIIDDHEETLFDSREASVSAQEMAAHEEVRGRTRMDLTSGSQHDPWKSPVGGGELDLEQGDLNLFSGSLSQATAPGQRKTPHEEDSGLVNLESLKVEDLVTLDASAEPTPLPEPKPRGKLAQQLASKRSNTGAPAGPGGSGAPPLPQGEGKDASIRFSPPQEEDESLELDPSIFRTVEPRGPRSDGANGNPAEKARISSPQLITSEASQARGLPIVPGTIPDMSAAPAAPVRSTGMSEALENIKGAIGRLLDHGIGGPAGGAVELFGGYFSERKRLRIITGFLVALALGAIIPVFHAKSAYSSHIQPLAQELSNARAHAKLIADLPQYRSPQAVEKAIDKLKTRYIAFTVLLWTALTGVIALLWFKLT